MRRLVWCLLVIGRVAQAGDLRVSTPPRELGLDAFYAKYCSADGVPVVAAREVSDAAVRQVARVVTAMLAPMPAVREELVKQHTRFGIVGVHEQTTDMPEYRAWPASANERGRGYGATPGQPLVTSGEENALCFEDDRWRGESIVVHEFAHTIKNMGLDLVVPGFRVRVQKAYDAAMRAGKFRGLYAATNAEEYWAEGVQDYFEVHQRHDPNDINTRASLAAYDPTLYAIIDAVFRGVRMPAVCPAPAFGGGWYRLESGGLAIDDGELRPSARVSGQLWQLTPLGDGRFRLSTMYRGPGRSLDVANDGVFEPVMADTGTYSGQMWTVTPIRAGAYRLVPLFQPDRSLAVESGRLVLAATADSPTQSWTIRLAR